MISFSDTARGWKQNLSIWTKYSIVIYFILTLQDPHTYLHGFAPCTSFSTYLEAKSYRYQRKYNLWRNTSLKHREVAMPTTRHHDLTPRTLLAMQKLGNYKGTILNNCCLFLLTAFLLKGNCTPVIAIVRGTITNWRKINSSWSQRVLILWHYLVGDPQLQRFQVDI